MFSLIADSNSIQNGASRCIQIVSKTSYSYQVWYKSVQLFFNKMDVKVIQTLYPLFLTSFLMTCCHIISWSFVLSVFVAFKFCDWCLPFILGGFKKTIGEGFFKCGLLLLLFTACFLYSPSFFVSFKSIWSPENDMNAASITTNQCWDIPVSSTEN